MTIRGFSNMRKNELVDTIVDCAENILRTQTPEYIASFFKTASNIRFVLFSIE
jgi:hypothetical protein